MGRLKILNLDTFVIKKKTPNFEYSHFYIRKILSIVLTLFETSLSIGLSVGPFQFLIALFYVQI